jgi:hypothetical protein
LFVNPSLALSWTCGHRIAISQRCDLPCSGTLPTVEEGASTNRWPPDWRLRIDERASEDSVKKQSLPPREQVFEGAILRTDETLCDRVEITALQAVKGDGNGVIWRGAFSLPARHDGCPPTGETLHIRLDDNSQIAIVVTEVAGRTFHFRARGKMPAPAT